VSDNPSSIIRASAVADLFTGLEEVLFEYQFLPEAQRRQRMAADADRITGEIARRLATTRGRPSPSFDAALARSAEG
jgi:hypothetical protein